MRIASTVLAFAAALTLIGATTAGAAMMKHTDMTSSSGTSPYDAKQWVVSVSAGFGDAGYYGNNQSPLYAVTAEYGINDKISVGGTVGHSSSDYEYSILGTNYKWTYGYTVVAARASYHFEEQIKVDKLDPYAGLELGYNSVSVKSPNNINGFSYSAGASATKFGAYAGGRYWFSPKWAGYGEAGFGIGNLVLGISTRF